MCCVSWLLAWVLICAPVFVTASETGVRGPVTNLPLGHLGTACLNASLLPRVSPDKGRRVCPCADKAYAAMCPI